MGSQRYDLTESARTALGSSSAKLLYAAVAKDEGDWHSIIHSHNFAELFLILGGRGSFLVNGMEYPVSPNDLVILNPHAEHTEISSDHAPLEYMVLGVRGIRFVNEEDGKMPFIIQMPQAAERIRRYVELLLTEARRKHPGYGAICGNLLNVILLHILGIKNVDIAPAAAERIRPECAALKSYIDDNFSQPLTLEDLAKAAHHNKYYVAHGFKKTFGISPMRYLARRRVEEAEFLLRETDYPIARISSMVGFSSMSVFSQTFKRITNHSPNAYRKLSKQQ